jgi:predicted thioredoxin/glutaredoxin
VTDIVVYSRQGCHLCEQLIEELLGQVRGRIDIQVRDIDTRDDWRRRYDMRVPVVKYDGELVCQYHLDREALARILSNHPI